MSLFWTDALRKECFTLLGKIFLDKSSRRVMTVSGVESWNISGSSLYRKTILEYEEQFGPSCQVD